MNLKPVYKTPAGKYFYYYNLQHAHLWQHRVAISKKKIKVYKTKLYIFASFFQSRLNANQNELLTSQPAQNSQNLRFCFKKVSKAFKKSCKTSLEQITKKPKNG